MSTRNDRFNRSMRSLDEFTASFDDPTKIAAFSDRGQGVERMLDEIDDALGRRKLGRRASCPSETLGRRASCPSENATTLPETATGETPVAPEPIVQVAQKLHKAEMRLYRAGLGYLVKVLRLIVKNGNNRKESIWELTEQ